jgi:hypothetical protein
MQERGGEGEQQECGRLPPFLSDKMSPHYEGEVTSYLQGGPYSYFLYASLPNLGIPDKLGILPAICSPSISLPSIPLTGQGEDSYIPPSSRG